jgi:surface carbohydrate biosynthesis protein
MPAPLVEWFATRAAETAMASGKDLRHIDVLWLVEHVDRELDVAICCAIEIERRFGLTVEIANYYTEFESLMGGVVPNVVLIPFFFSAEDIGSKQYAARWPEATLINLRWEQILYKVNQSLKQVRGDTARSSVWHVAWSEESAGEAIAQGVRPDKVLLTGHPLFSLYEPSYRGAFVSRSELAQRHGLSPARRWLFFPENYRWAFVKDSSMRKLEARGTGVAAAALADLRAYCRDSLHAALVWLDRIARDDGWEVVFRPRPSTNTEDLQELVSEVLPDRAPRLHVIKDRSVRDWTLASDHVMSSFSTSLIEAALAGKPINTVSPAPVPELLQYEWCGLVHDVATADAMASALRDPANRAPAAPLAAWARSRFEPRGNPVVVLAEEIGRIASRYRLDGAARVTMRDEPPPASPKGLFSRRSHDKDHWTPESLALRKAQFTATIAETRRAGEHQGASHDTAHRKVPLSIVICTHNREEHLRKLLDSLVDQEPHRLDLEILVVDNRSSDGTMAFCRERQRTLPALRYCFEAALGLSHARNRGIAASQHPHILYLDDDATVPRRYLQTAASIIAERDPDFFGGPVYPAFAAERPAWFHDQFEVRRYTSEPKFILDRSISGGNFGVRRAVVEGLGGFDPSLGMAGSRMRFMEERTLIERYRFATPTRRQRIFYHPDLFISHYTGPAKLTLSYQLRRAFQSAQSRVLVESRFALASGAMADAKGNFTTQAGVLLAGARTFAAESARATLSGSPRLTPAAAKGLVKIARSIGELRGYWSLWRDPSLDAPPPEGVLFIRAPRLSGKAVSEEIRDGLMSAADATGLRAGLLDTDVKSDDALEPLLRRERFRTYRKVIALGYLPAPRKQQLRTLCGETPLLDFSDVSPLSASVDPRDSRTIASWLREVWSHDRPSGAHRREGVLMIAGGPTIAKALLGRDAWDTLLAWFRASGIRADLLRLKGARVTELVMQAGAPSYNAILALGVMSVEGKRELQNVVGDVKVADLADLGCAREAYRAVAGATDLEETAAAAPLLEALRSLAGVPSQTAREPVSD